MFVVFDIYTNSKEHFHLSDHRSFTGDVFHFHFSLRSRLSLLFGFIRSQLLVVPRRLRRERVPLPFLISISDPLNALVLPSDYIKVR